MEGIQPRINPRRIALGWPRTETDPDGNPVTVVKGSYGSFLLRIRLTPVTEYGKTCTEVELSLRQAPAPFVLMVFFVLIILVVQLIAGGPIRDALGFGFAVFLVVFLPCYLIGALALPDTLDKLEKYCDAAFLSS